MTDYSPQFPSIEKSLNGTMMGDMSKRLVVNRVALHAYDSDPGEGLGDHFILPWGPGVFQVWVVSDNINEHSTDSRLKSGAVYFMSYKKEDGNYHAGTALQYDTSGGVWQENALHYFCLAYDFVESTWVFKNGMGIDGWDYEFSFIFDYTDW